MTASLLDHHAEGLLALLLLREGHRPQEAEPFRRQVLAWLDEVARAAPRGAAAQAADYAVCAHADETVLGVPDALRDAWAPLPLQALRHDEHLAGEGFFRRLEDLLRDPVANREPLEVFQACLQQGFQGRHILDPPEVLAGIRERLDQALAAPVSPEPPPPSPAPLPIWHRLRPGAVLLALALLLLATYLALRGLLLHLVSRIPDLP